MALLSEPKTETVVSTLKPPKEPAVIPTTFVPFAPEKIHILEGKVADVLCGLFHVMWKDMAQPSTYPMRLSEKIDSNGIYSGCSFEYGRIEKKVIDCTN